MSNKFIVMTAKAKMPGSCWGKYGRVAVVECSGEHAPKQIHPNHKSVKSIVQTWERRSIGSTDRCAFSVALKEAKELAVRLNAAS